MHIGRSKTMTDSKYFTTNREGKSLKLKAELNNERKKKRKEAVKKVIAGMTVWCKDVISSRCRELYMQIDNLN